MFAAFMIDAWIVASVVAVVAGLVGFFTLLRGSAFAAHAVPNGSFAGAAAAALVGVNTLIGLGVFSAGAAAGIGWLSRRGRRDVATALILTFMLGLGSLLLSRTSAYGPSVYSLLFGEVLGVSANQMWPTVGLALACLLGLGTVYRPLLLNSVLPDAGQARGVSSGVMEFLFLGLLALTTTMTVPVVGTLLIFSLMIGPASAARALAADPRRAMLLSVGLALATAWISIAAAYWTNYPVGFFVGSISAVSYLAARLGAARRGDRSRGRW